MKTKNLLIFFFLMMQLIFAQEKKFSEENLAISTKTTTINGTLLTPNLNGKPPLIIIIPGSGPTDRDGNSSFLKNNSLKFLAEDLSNSGIATFRYDKSVLALKKTDTLLLKKLTFNTFINEAEQVVTFFKNQHNYSKLIIAGHSQGSLVGMIAANKNVDGFISISGAGRTIDLILIDQIAKQAPFLKDETVKILNELKQGKLVTKINPMLLSLFNKQIQPFLISWINFNPQEELKKLTIPILILNGTVDLQVPTSEANLLHKANPSSNLEIIPNMNHILKEIKGNETENMQSYSNPNLPIIKDISTIITNFVNNIK